MDLAGRVARLSAGQRECLDLVDDHATSKEIARQLGISRHTVDARLRGAIQTLGVTSRREAAIIYRAAMQAEAYQPFAYQTPRIVSVTPRAENLLQEQTCREVDDAPEAADQHYPAHIPGRSLEDVRRPAAAFVADSAVWAAPEVWNRPQLDGQTGRPLLRLWGGANDLSPSQRLLGVLIVMIGAMLAFGVFLSGIEALTLLRS